MEVAASVQFHKKLLRRLWHEVDLMRMLNAELMCGSVGERAEGRGCGQGGVMVVEVEAPNLAVQTSEEQEEEPRLVLPQVAPTRPH